VVLLEVEAGLDSYLDRIAIGMVSSGGGSTCDQPPDEAWCAWKDIWLDAGHPDLFTDAKFRQLVRANEAVWEAKDVVDRGLSTDTDVPYQILIRYCRQLYLANDVRCEVKAELARTLCSAFWDEKEYFSYDDRRSEFNPIDCRWLD
jgi:hypothetical protein